jgi:predicted ATPase
MLIDEILVAAPGVKILVTSRERLNLQGESLFRLEGFNFPDWNSPEAALEYSAVKLFAQSARYAQPEFELRVDDLHAVANICRRLEGLPLGIILAASWVEMIPVQNIEHEIASNLDFLETEARNIPERQRSIRAVFDYSWALLNDSERDSFMKVCVFRGGFSREAAQAVAGSNLRVLTALVNKSLLRRNPVSGRYTFHELLRQFAEQKLEVMGQIQAVRGAHSDYFLNFMYDHRDDLASHKPPTAGDDIEADMENVRTAWSYAIDMKRYAAIQRAMVGLIPGQN